MLAISAVQDRPMVAHGPHRPAIATARPECSNRPSAGLISGDPAAILGLAACRQTERTERTGQAHPSSSPGAAVAPCQALFGVSLDVQQGEAVALLGPNGAGKTTVLRSILGLTPARRGAIRFGGKEITRAATSDIACSGIGWVPDDRRIFPALKVKTNLALGKKKTAFRSWSESDNVTRKGCYARAREWDSTLPDLDAQPLIGDELRAVLGHRLGRPRPHVRCRRHASGHRRR